jgi:hypothetical protein
LKHFDHRKLTQKGESSRGSQARNSDVDHVAGSD